MPRLPRAVQTQQLRCCHHANGGGWRRPPQRRWSVRSRLGTACRWWARRLLRGVRPLACRRLRPLPCRRALLPPLCRQLLRRLLCLPRHRPQPAPGFGGRHRLAQADEELPQESLRLAQVSPVESEAAVAPGVVSTRKRQMFRAGHSGRFGAISSRPSCDRRSLGQCRPHHPRQRSPSRYFTRVAVETARKWKFAATENQDSGAGCCG